MGLSFSIEETLVRRRRYRTAFRIRKFKKFFATPEHRKSQREWLSTIIEEWGTSRDAIMKQTYYERKIARKQKRAKSQGRDLTSNEEAAMESWKVQVKREKKVYWRAVRKWKDMASEFPDGPWARGYRQVYEILRWHSEQSSLSPADLFGSHVSKCQDLSNCCSRKCGCCARPRAWSAIEGYVYAHCSTLYCDCCIRARGFQNPWSEDVDDFLSESELEDEEVYTSPSLALGASAPPGKTNIPAPWRPNKTSVPAENSTGKPAASSASKNTSTNNPAAKAESPTFWDGVEEWVITTIEVIRTSVRVLEVAGAMFGLPLALSAVVVIWMYILKGLIKPQCQLTLWILTQGWNLVFSAS